MTALKTSLREHPFDTELDLGDIRTVSASRSPEWSRNDERFVTHLGNQDKPA